MVLDVEWLEDMLVVMKSRQIVVKGVGAMCEVDVLHEIYRVIPSTEFTESFFFKREKVNLDSFFNKIQKENITEICSEKISRRKTIL